MCPTCAGSGECQVCQGSGYIGDNEDDPCVVCSESGECPDCAGD